ncbi:MAG: YdcF family protein [Lachnospiraceae bacterium]|nr:YdcF family protein [Lachnospiraceae bacterium]
MVLEIFLYVFGAFNILYFGFYSFNFSMNNPFLWFILGGGALLCALGAVHNVMRVKDIHFPIAVKVVICILAAIVIISFIIAEAVVIKGANDKPKEYPDIIIIPGARVMGTTISTNLRNRLDKALEYYNSVYDENKGEVYFICSGGQGPGEDISEALAMKNYLMENGIDESKILMEDKSKNTYQNMKYSYEKAKSIKKTKEELESSEVVIFTNSFHVARSCIFAKKIGFKNAKGIGAGLKPGTEYLCYTREACSLIFYKLKGVY